MCHIDLIFHVHILGVYIHKFARYKVSMIKAVTGRAVHRRCQCWQCRCWWHGWQHHTTDRAWLHRLITKWAKNCNVLYHSVLFCTKPSLKIRKLTKKLRLYVQRMHENYSIKLCPGVFPVKKGIPRTRPYVDMEMKTAVCSIVQEERDLIMSWIKTNNWTLLHVFSVRSLPLK